MRRRGGTLAEVSTDPKDRWHDLGAFIREQRGSARLSLRRLSELAGISNPYLSQIERGLRRPSAEILQQIAKALRISAETLYVQAGILEPPEASPDLTRAIMVDPSISEEHKQALVRIYLSFRREYEEERAARASEHASTADASTSAPSTTDASTADPSTADPSTSAPSTRSPDAASGSVSVEASVEKDGRAKASGRRTTRPSATASA
jgi:transcriptional regulator with XRE-family HTH domain